MSSIRIPLRSRPRGYTAFGCLDFVPDMSGHGQELLLTGVVACPGPVPLPELGNQDGDVELIQSPGADPFAAFAEDVGAVRFHFLVNLLDPECRDLLERSTAQGTFQMLLTSRTSEQPGGFQMQRPFIEALALTAGRGHGPFDAWVKTCVEQAPDLPELFAQQHHGSPAPGTHCVVVMLPRSRLGDIAAMLD